jgi:soluble lytic murein transglycosylase
MKTDQGPRTRYLRETVWRALLVLTLCGVPVLATADQPQRELFLKAEQALEQHTPLPLPELQRRLRGYPLLPYLELAYLQDRLPKAHNAEVRRFLHRYHGQPVADILRRQWLDELARKKRWRSYLAFYTPQSNIRRRCNHLLALIRTGQRRKAWPGVKKIWLYGRSRPSACDPVFKAWAEAGRRTPKLVWARIALAMEAGQWRLARYLEKSLPRSERTWVERWITLLRDPRSLPRRLAGLRQEHPYREAIIAHTVRHLARFDGQAALDLWHAVRTHYPFTRAQRHKVVRRIAIALERDDSARAYRFINELDHELLDRRLRQVQFNAALRRLDWPRVLQRLRGWPKEDQKTERWRYWYARALQQTGHPAEARRRFTRLARARSYYGFLAADQVGLPYHLDHRDTPRDRLAELRLKRLPGIRRALELYALDRHQLARREWHYATRRLGKDDLRAAALIAEGAQWHDQAIFTLARTGYWDDLKLRFPLEYRELVADNARRNTLDVSWVYAIIRQESAFMDDARSGAGALGLMQLMPGTARAVAHKLPELDVPRRQELLRPALNIALGSAYLSQLKQRLMDNPVLATAAYNAGPHRVDRWLPRQQQQAADIWVELVPFSETRRYLRRVMSYMVIYDKRLGRQPKRLRERMKPIQAASASDQLAGA